MFTIIASERNDIPQVVWTRFGRLCKARDLIGGQPVLVSFPPVTRRRKNRQSVASAQSTPQIPTRSQLINSPASSSPGLAMAQNTAPNAKEFAAMMIAVQRTMDTVNQRMAAQDDVIVNLRRTSGASAL
ncbi:unnamed protein product [Camellia sinensis]